jgi:CHAT domain-containing protein/tetratricopeptide (TPR) repeat protein
MTNAVTCLAPETIAAYLDRRLDPAERTRVEEHLADCEECRTLLTETAAFLEADAAAKPDAVPGATRPARRPWVWSAAAAAAALLALTPFVLRQMRPTPESALRDLDRALGGKRYIEARLSGFEYGEYVAPKRGPRDTDLPPAVLGAAGHVQELASKTDTPENLAALGASQLAIGRFDDAVQNLEDAALLAPKNARIQSDLAAAYIARFRANPPDDYAEDPAKALEAAATALRIDPKSRAAAFNRALSLEMLPLRGEAQRAWAAYLILDPSSHWADEARARMKDLTRPLPAPPPSPSAKLDELESLVFPDWGRAVLTRRLEDAQAAISRARTLATEIEDLDGDRLALETLSAIDAASPSRLISLARAHVLVGEARHDYLDGRFKEADNAFAEAHRILRSEHSPYANWLLMRLSTSRFQLVDTSGARAALDVLGRNDLGNTGTLVARSLRMSGLLRVREGAFADSLAEYTLALTALARDESGDDTIALRFLVGENLELLGDRPAAWRELRAGLSRLHIIRNTRQRHARVFETATYALRQGRPWVAFHLLDSLLEESSERLPSRTLAECLLHKARILSSLGDAREAVRLMEASASAVSEAERSGALPRLRAEWLAARGEVLATASPQEAIVSLSEVQSIFAREEAEWRLAAVRLTLGRARAASGDVTGADLDLAAAIDIVERQLSPLRTDQLRVSFFALSADAFAERIRLAAEQGLGPEQTFDLSERSKARGLRDRRGSNPEPMTIDAVRARLPAGVVLVSYVVLADRLLVWRLASDRLDSWSEPIGSSQLDRLVDSFTRDVERQRDSSTAAEELYNLLVRRSLSTQDVKSLVVVPDGCLNRLAFSALMDRQSGRYLVEQTTLAIAPSATLFAAGLASLPPGERKRLLIVQPSDGTAEALPYAAEEARALAELYPDSTVLSGSAATKSAFFAHAPRSAILHFSGHAIVNEATPFLSRLLLAADAGRRTGHLFAHELGGLDLSKTHLAVLAACTTGTGPTYAGEGAISLARPFLAAGVPAVVASLWKIDDRAARRQILAFYRAIIVGQAPGHALRQSQLEMLRSDNETLRHPSTWAAFELFATSPSTVAGG